MSNAKYSVASGANSVGRYVRKLAAIACHGAKCFICGKKFDPSNRDEAAWQFAHIEPVRDQDDKSDRWGGGWRDEREIAMRKRVYPRFVEQKKMAQAEADRQVAIMEEIAEDYR